MCLKVSIKDNRRRKFITSGGRQLEDSRSENLLTKQNDLTKQPIKGNTTRESALREIATEL